MGQKKIEESAGQLDQTELEKGLKLFFVPVSNFKDERARKSFFFSVVCVFSSLNIPTGSVFLFYFSLCLFFVCAQLLYPLLFWRFLIERQREDAKEFSYGLDLSNVMRE